MRFAPDELQRFIGGAPRRSYVPPRIQRERLRRRIYWLLTAGGIAIFLLFAATLRWAEGAEPAELARRIQALEGRVAQLEADRDRLTRVLLTFETPGRLDFAGERVPLERWDVRERLERELLLSVQERGQVLLWLKRAARYFPHIDASLRRAGLPADLRYVAVIESALLPQALSSAKALGIWQFIPGTARRYGLRITPWWDARRDPELATQAAVAYLADLHREFGDWALALAAYNSGEGRVRTAIRHQGVRSYFQLALPRETERYVFRAYAAKLILSEPERFGFHLPAAEGYRPPARDRIQLRVRRAVSVRAIAEATGTFYREVKQLNPAITADRLPAGRYPLNLPEGAAAGFALKEDGGPRASGRSVTHRVRRGETLAGIARQYRVTVESLRRRNPSARTRYIHPGDLLVIR